MTLTVANLTTTVGTPVLFTLDASFVDGYGRVVHPTHLSWSGVRSGNGSDVELAHGSTLPASFVETFQVAGFWAISASVDADGFDEATAKAAMQVVAAPGGCTHTSTLAAPKALTPVLLGGGFGEPSIAIDGQDDVFVAPIQPLFRSMDGGQTFSPAGATTGGGDGDISVGVAGGLYWAGLSGSATDVQISHDYGSTFSAPVDVSNGTTLDRQWIDARPGGPVYVTWRDTGGVIRERTSFDGGHSWGAARAVAPDGQTGKVFHGPIPGEVYFPVARGTSLRLEVSDDDGANWVERAVDTAPDSITGDPTMPAIAFWPFAAADCAGTLYFVYAAENGNLPTEAVSQRLSRYGVYLLVSHNQGATWSRRQLLSTPGHAAVMPALVAGGAGRVAIAWYENVNGLPSENLPDEWNVQLWESVAADSTSPAPQNISLTTTPSHIGAICSSGSLCTGDRSLLDFFSITLNSEGQPRAAWMSSTLGTPIGVAVQGPDAWYGGADGTPLGNN
ncbi:MAG: sialidase family protein [Thermoplasmatota archaeon]